MNFFGKKNHKTEEEAPVQVQPAPPAPTYEPPRMKRDARILNSTQLQRVKDAKRLAETKLQGLEESLARTQAQQQWLRRYSEVLMILDREKKRLFELGKQRAILAKDASMLERYDLFEGVHGTYQKIAVLTNLIGQDKRGLSLLEREADEKRQAIGEQEKKLLQAAEQEKSASSAFLSIHDNLWTFHRMQGNNEGIDAEIAFLHLQYNNVREEMEALASQIAEKEALTEALASDIEQLSAKRQSIEMHENMLQHGEATLLRLNLLHDVDKRRSELKQRLQQATKRQDEENEMLGKAFAQYQDLVSQTETIEAELSMHRTYIHGQDGFRLQERAMMLKSRRQMLLSALSLWKRISTGYGNIEENGSRVTQLRLHIQHLEDGVLTLETETGKALRLCKEKEYSYLLSKGQDIIQLRADLREGVSCSVCGATHHPYHSDTMLDQSKLIGQMKTDFELLASESQAKQQQLTEMKMELASARGQLSTLEAALNNIRIRQNEDVQEWKLYAELDSTFAECSESTNLEARTVTLRQLIENVSRDAETAQKELETFTFHQSSIAQLSEQLQKLEQRKGEINVRLSELNTGCQVLSREVEQIGDLLDDTNKSFTNIYESILLTITIKDWYTIWQKNPEQLNEQIQKLIIQWHSFNQDITAKESTLRMEQATLEVMRTLMKIYQRFSSVITQRSEDQATRKAENDKLCQKLIPEGDAKFFYQTYLQASVEARNQFEQQQHSANSIRHEVDIMQGRHDFYLANIAKLEAEQSKLREKLDLWMHGFNLQHPPVQFGELEEVFAEGKDWSLIRSSLKQIMNDTLLCQAKVEDLNSRIIAMETEDGRCSTTSPDIQETIAAKQQMLMQQRSDTMMQIARLALQLEDHEKGLAAERNSAEPDAPQQD